MKVNLNSDSKGKRGVWALLCIFCFSLLVAYWFFEYQPPAKKQELLSVPRLQSREIKQESVKVFKKEKPSIGVSKKDRTSYRNQKSVDLEGVIFFEEKNSMAISFGDILLGMVPPEYSSLGEFKKTKANEIQKWEKGVVPYIVSSDVLEKKEIIEEIISYFQEETSLLFVPYTQQKNAILFQYIEEGCYSYVGRVGGIQPIYLSEDCNEKSVAHEIMHALGFFHEQSRRDRDQFVEVVWENVEEDKKNNFLKVPDKWKSSEVLSFDYSSAMLYSPYAFSKNGENTLRFDEKKWNQDQGFQEREEGQWLSPMDIKKIKILYKEEFNKRGK